MILMTENGQKKELVVYVYSDDYGNDAVHPWYQSEVKRYTELGYTIHSIVFPLVSNLPTEARKIYNSIYHSKAILDTLITTAQDDIFPSVLAQVVRDEMAKYKIQDIAQAVVDAENAAD